MTIWGKNNPPSLNSYMDYHFDGSPYDGSPSADTAIMAYPFEACVNYDEFC